MRPNLLLAIIVIVSYSPNLRAQESEKTPIEMTIKKTFKTPLGSFTISNGTKSGVGMSFGNTTAKSQPVPTRSVKSTKRLLESSKIIFDTQVKSADVISEKLTTVYGVKRKFKRQRTVEQTLTYVDTKKLEGIGGLDVKILSAEIRASSEKTLGRTLSEKATVTEEIEMDGDKVQAVEIVWCDQFRTGQLEVLIDGKRVQMPFQYRIGTRLDVRPVSKPQKANNKAVNRSTHSRGN